MKRKTYQAKPNEIVKKWYIVDAKGKVLGRLASAVATVLRGKHKPNFTTYIDTGDFVVVVNAEAVKVTGKKEKEKLYFTHSGYPGGDKQTSLETFRSTRPDMILRHAVAGMLPKGRLGRKIIGKLKIYKGGEHPFVSQKLETLPI